MARFDKNLISRIKRPKVQFKVGDYLVYPVQGVGKVVDIKTQEILKELRECYVIEIKSNNLKIILPTDKVAELKVRSIIKESQVNKVLNILKKDEYDDEEDWKLRHQKNLEKFKSGDIYLIADVCRNLSKRSKEKGLSLMERRLYEDSYQLIINELALCQSVDIEDAGNTVSEAIS